MDEQKNLGDQQELQTNHFQNKSKQESFQCVSSQFYTIYQGLTKNYSCPSLEDIKERLCSSGKISIKQNYSLQLTIKQVDTDCQSVLIELHYGIFASQIRVINLFISHDSQESSYAYSGKFGQIFRILSQNSNYQVVKVINLGDSQNKQRDVYQEYFIALLASQLRVGPKIIYQTGYDIIFLKNHAIFRMEQCLKSQPKSLYSINTQKNSSHSDSQLFQCLKILHRLNIVHNDITTNNICWSPKYRKSVLLDFGFSAIISEEVGYKTLRNFCGTYSFCSQQMKKLFTLRSKGYVDLYYNDLYGLMKVIKDYKNKKEYDNSQQNNNQSEYYNQFYTDLLEYLKIKASIFNRNYSQAYSKINRLVMDNRMLESSLVILGRCLSQEKMSNDLMHESKKLQKYIRYQMVTKLYKATSSDKKISTNEKQCLQNTNNIFITKKQIEIFIQNNHKVQAQISNHYIEVLNNRHLNQFWVWVNRMLFVLYPQNFIHLVYKYHTTEIAVQKHGCFVHKLYSLVYHFKSNDETHCKRSLMVNKFRYILLYFRQTLEDNPTHANIIQVRQLTLMFWLIRDTINIQKMLRLEYKLEKNALKYVFRCINFYFLQQSASTSRLLGYNHKLIDNANTVIAQLQSKSQPQQITNANNILIASLVQFTNTIKQSICQKYKYIDHSVEARNNKLLQIFQKIVFQLAKVSNQENLSVELETFKNSHHLFQIIAFRYKIQFESERLFSSRRKCLNNNYQSTSFQQQEFQNRENKIQLLLTQKEMSQKSFVNKLSCHQKIQKEFGTFSQLSCNKKQNDQQQLKIITQKMKYFFQIGEGDHRSFFINFHCHFLFQIKQSKIKKSEFLKIIILYLQIRTKLIWRQKEDYQLYGEISTVFQVIFQTFFSIPKELRESDLFCTYTAAVENILEQYGKKLQKLVNQQRITKISMNQILNLMKIIKFLQETSPFDEDKQYYQQFINRMETLCCQLLENKNDQAQRTRQSFMQFQTNKISLLKILVRLTNIYTHQYPLSKINRKIEHLWSMIPVQALFYMGGLFKTLMNINNTDNNYQKNYYLLHLSIKYLSINSHEREQNLYFVVYQEAIIQFCEHAPLQYLCSCIKNTNMMCKIEDVDMDKKITIRDITYRSFMILFIINKCHSVLTRREVLSITYSIANAFKYMNNYSHRISKSVYFLILKNYITMNVRKDLVYERILCRSKLKQNWKILAKKIQRNFNHKLNKGISTNNKSMIINKMRNKLAILQSMRQIQRSFLAH